MGGPADCGHELAAALIELIGRDASHDQGHSTLKRPVGDREEGVAVLPAAAGLQIRPAHDLAQDAH